MIWKVSLSIYCNYILQFNIVKLVQKEYHLTEHQYDVITSTKEVMFSPGVVCGLVSLFVKKITLKLVDKKLCNFHDMSEKVKGRNVSILGVIRITIWIF